MAKPWASGSAAATTAAAIHDRQALVARTVVDPVIDSLQIIRCSLLDNATRLTSRHGRHPRAGLTDAVHRLPGTRSGYSVVGCRDVKSRARRVAKSGSPKGKKKWSNNGRSYVSQIS